MDQAARRPDAGVDPAEEQRIGEEVDVEHEPRAQSQAQRLDRPARLVQRAAKDLLGQDQARHRHGEQHAEREARGGLKALRVEEPGRGRQRDGQRRRLEAGARALQQHAEKQQPAARAQRVEHGLHAPQDGEPGEREAEIGRRRGCARDGHAEKNRRSRAAAPAQAEVDREGEERGRSEAIAECGGIAHLELSASRSGREQSRPSAEAPSGREPGCGA